MKSLIPKIIKIGLYSIFVLPLIFTPFTFFPWHFGKTLIFEIIVEALVVLFLVRIIFCHSRESGNPANQQKNSGFSIRSGVTTTRLSLQYYFNRLNLLDYSLLLFLLIIFITSFTGVNFVNSFWGNQSRANGVFVWFHFGLFYFLLKHFFQDKKDWLKIFVINTATAFLVGLSFIFQKYLPAAWQSTAAGGLVGNRAFFASYILISLGLALYLLINFKSKVKWLWSAAFLFFLFLIFYSGIRGTFVGLAVGIFIGLVAAIFNSNNKKIKLGFGAISLLFLLTVGSLLALRNQDFIKNNFPKIYNLTNFSYTEGTGATRLMAWDIAFKGMAEKPVLGWGWGNYEIPFNKYYNPQFLKYGFSETVWDKPHNWLLEIGVTGGVAGMLSYLLILFFGGFSLVRRLEPRQARRSDFVDSASKIILFSTLVAYFIQDLFLFETTVSLIPWFALLAFVSLFFIGTKQRENTSSLFFLWLLKIKKVFFVLTIVLFIFCLYFNFSLFKTSYLMRQAELSDNFVDWKNYANQVLDDRNSVFAFENAYFLSEKFSQFDKADAFNNIKKDEEQIGLKIIKELNSYSVKNKNNYNAYFWAGKTYTVLGERVDARYYLEAEKKFLLAQKLAPDKQELLFVLGRLYLLGNNFPRAIEVHELAVSKAPNLGVSHWFLGLAYIGAGDTLKGVSEIEKAQTLGYTLDRGQEQYLAEIYFETKQFSKLVESYKKISAADPKNIDWQIKLAVAYALNGDKKNALEIARSLAGQYPELKPQVEQFINQYKLK